jgi:hypothetical protein
VINRVAVAAARTSSKNHRNWNRTGLMETEPARSG